MTFIKYGSRNYVQWHNSVTLNPKSHWILIGVIRSFLKSPLRHNGVDVSITLDAAKWNCDDAELSSCVITLFYWIMYYNIQNTFGTNLHC